MSPSAATSPSVNSTIRSVVAGVGSYLPEKVVTNAELAKRVDTSDEWIQQRTGIQQRHIAADEQGTADLAVEAARAALKDAGMAAEDVDMILVATTSPDRTFPSTATLVQQKLGLRSGFAFDLQAACSGFVYGLATADNFIKTGQVKTALVIGAEIFSRLVDWEDRTTCVLFGDGAGAFVLKASDDSTENGILSTHLYSDGTYYDLLCTNGGPATTQTAGVVQMQGREVFKHAVSKMAVAVNDCLAHNNLKDSDIDYLVPHQANQRIIDSMGDKLGLPTSQVISTVAQHANTSAASIPLAFSEGVKDGRIRRDALVLLEALGAGFTWGSALLRY